MSDMNPNDIALEIYRAAAEIPEPFSALSEAQRRRIAELLTRYEDAEALYGALPYGQLLHPMLLSKNGRYEEALALTEQHYRQAPSWETAVAVANAARRSGDVERAVVMFARGAEHDPSDETCWLEVGDIRLGQGQFAEALEAYERALLKDPAHPWALPSAFYCRHRLGIEGNWLASLREVANQEGCTCGLSACLALLGGGYGSEDAIARARYLLTIARQERQSGVQ